VSQNIARPPIVIGGGGAGAVDMRARARLEDAQGIYNDSDEFEEKPTPPDLRAEEHFPGLPDPVASSRQSASARNWGPGAYCAPVGHRAHLDFPALSAHQPGTQAPSVQPQNRSQRKQGKAARRNTGRPGEAQSPFLQQNGCHNSRCSPLEAAGPCSDAEAVESVASKVFALGLESSSSSAKPAVTGSAQAQEAQGDWLDRCIDDMCGRRKGNIQKSPPQPTLDDFPSLVGPAVPIAGAGGGWGPAPNSTSAPQRQALGASDGPLATDFPLLGGDSIPPPPGLGGKGSSSIDNKALTQALKVWASFDLCHAVSLEIKSRMYR
jgi:hypothetical protein